MVSYGKPQYLYSIPQIQDNRLSDLIPRVSELGGIPWVVYADADFINKNGNFLNHTKTMITGHNDTAGFSITGRQNATSGSNYMSGRLRCDFKLDFTNISKVIFYGKKVVNHGIICVYVSDGLGNVLHDNFSPYAYIDISYTPTPWTQYSLDTSKITGIRTLSFVGGYVDTSGSTSSQTQYSGIEFHYST